MQLYIDSLRSAGFTGNLGGYTYSSNQTCLTSDQFLDHYLLRVTPDLRSTLIREPAMSSLEQDSALPAASSGGEASQQAAPRVQQHNATGNELIDESLTSPAPPLLHTLAQAGDNAKITVLLNAGEATADDRDAEGISALHWSAMNSHTSLCKLLLERGAEVDAVGGELQATPLHWAARYAKA